VLSNFACPSSSWTATVDSNRSVATGRSQGANVHFRCFCRRLDCHQRDLRDSITSMSIAVRPAQPATIESLRGHYRKEMNCQIVHDSIHGRPGWTREFAIYIDALVVGYGSLAVGGPWRAAPTLFEFYVYPAYRMRTFELFEQLLAHCDAIRIETQSNDRYLTVMLHTYAHNVRAEAILFEDGVQTQLMAPGAGFRAATDLDRDSLRELDLDEGAAWVIISNGVIAGAGGGSLPLQAALRRHRC
jgi:hypothetical protein